MTKIYHAHLYGLREHKYQVLAENTVNSTNFKEVNPQSSFYLLIPQDRDLFSEYEQYFKVTEVMPFTSTGIKTHRDHFVLDFDYSKLYKRISNFRDLSISNENIAKQYNLKDTRDWTLSPCRQSLANDSNWLNYFTKCLYRPFDFREYYHHKDVVELPRSDVMKHLFRKNMALVANRQVTSIEFCHILCTENIIEMKTCSHDRGTNLFPLYLYPDINKPQELQQKKRPNFSPDFLKTLEPKLGYLPTPEAIFYYIYAIFHSRTRYAEFLKIDFPRVPLTSNDNLFRQLSDYGEQLVQLHLMTSPLIKGGWGDLSFVSKGDRIVAAGHPKYSKGEVHINKQGDCFKGVPEEVWNFYIGGYQVCQKWLKDRKDRTLSVSPRG